MVKLAGILSRSWNISFNCLILIEQHNFSVINFWTVEKAKRSLNSKDFCYKKWRKIKTKPWNTYKDIAKRRHIYLNERYERQTYNRVVYILCLVEVYSNIKHQFYQFNMLGDISGHVQRLAKSSNAEVYWSIKERPWSHTRFGDVSVVRPRSDELAMVSQLKVTLCAGPQYALVIKKPNFTLYLQYHIFLDVISQCRAVTST